VEIIAYLKVMGKVGYCYGSRHCQIKVGAVDATALGPVVKFFSVFIQSYCVAVRSAKNFSLVAELLPFNRFENGCCYHLEFTSSVYLVIFG